LQFRNDRQREIFAHATTPSWSELFSAFPCSEMDPFPEG
jgi:hypothetical protein